MVSKKNIAAFNAIYINNLWSISNRAFSNIYIKYLVFTSSSFQSFNPSPKLFQESIDEKCLAGPEHPIYTIHIYVCVFHRMLQWTIAPSSIATVVSLMSCSLSHAVNATRYSMSCMPSSILSILCASSQIFPKLGRLYLAWIRNRKCFNLEAASVGLNPLLSRSCFYDDHKPVR